jgi:hypothetical protein
MLQAKFSEPKKMNNTPYTILIKIATGYEVRV